MSEPVRLAKRVAELACSRREAEQYIEGGWVRVDGEVVEEPQYRVADRARRTRPAARPGGAGAGHAAAAQARRSVGDAASRLLVPAARAPDDPSGIRTVKRHFAQLAPLLPLPPPASGLVVFSQDRRIVRKLTEDAATIEQELIAQVAGQISPDGLALLGHGLVFEGQPLPPIKVSWQQTRPGCALRSRACAPRSRARHVRAGRPAACWRSSASASAACRWPACRPGNGAICSRASGSEPAPRAMAASASKKV